jgi:hypothetical protein
MRWARWITPLWPGLTQLWFSGAWWGLAIGCSFAWLVNLAVVSTFVWTELVGPWSRLGVWVLLVLVWGASLALSFRQLLGVNPADSAEAAEDLFRRAGREYLSGNWIEAELLLTQVIRLNGKDVDAQLMLASLLRRTGQLTEAAARLRRLESTDGSDKWASEIARERLLLDEQFHPPAATENETSSTSSITPQNKSTDEESSANQAA